MQESYHTHQSPVTKICNTCQQEKPFTDFHRRTDAPDGYHGICKVCRKVVSSQPKKITQRPLFILSKICTDCGQEKLIEDFFPSKKGAYGYMSRCKQCSHDRGHNWRQEHLEEERAKARKSRHDRYWEDSEKGEAYRVMIRAARDRWHERNPEKRRENWNRYNARKLYSATTEAVDYEAILERDGMFCYICQQDILASQDINFDHVIPVSRNGSHMTENIKVTHAICNQRKGDKLLAEMKPAQRRGPDKHA